LGEAAKVEQLKGSGIDPQRQKSPHPHSINITKEGRLLIPISARTRFLSITRTSRLPSRVANIKPGSGPRHMAFHPRGMSFT